MEESRQSGDTRKRKITALAVFAVIGIIGLVAINFYVQYKKNHITTDDAFVEGRVHVVSSRVPGTVKQVFAGDNQFVRKGDLLLEIDAADYEVKLQEAESGVQAERSKLTEATTKIETARNQLSEYAHRVDAQRAHLELQEANLRQAEVDLRRAENLIKKEAISRDRYDRTRTGYDVARAQVRAAQDQLKQAEASLATQRAVIRQAESAQVSQKSLISQREAARNAAELFRSYAKIHAPADGYITKKSVEAGNQIQSGQPLLAVVPLDDIWIIANFKETQLERIRLKQTVQIRVDTYPDRKFRGTVDSIMAGTGAVFSLFPPENATGNFVKVVQRVPVKIVLEKDTDKEHILRVGMSVVPTVLVE